jgi:HK97 family phage major capsid protein
MPQPNELPNDLIIEGRTYKKTDTLIQFGGQVKRDRKGHYGGHLVLFGSPDEKDLYGDYFTSGTDYDLQEGQRSATYYQHSFDYHFKSSVLGRATLGMDDLGIWIDTQVQIRDEYLEALDQMIADGMMGWSSGTAGHLVEYQRTGKAYWIKRWPLGLDASITPSPADPRQSVATLKSLQSEWAKQFGTAPREADVEPLRFYSFRGLWEARNPTPKAAPEDVEALEGTAELTVEAQPATPIHITLSVEGNMPENQELSLESLNNRIDEFSGQMSEILSYIKGQPNLRRAGYVTDDGGDKDPNVRSFGDFCLAVMRGDTKRLRSVYKSHQNSDVAVKTDMVEDSGNLGGWAIPEDFDTRLLQATLKASSFLSLVPRIPVTLPSGRWPYLDIFTAPTAGGGGTAESAGITSAGRAEGGAYTETNANLEQLEWRVNDAITGSIQVSKELRRDVGALEGLLYRLVAINDQAKQEYFVLRGNGGAQPLGILNSDALIDVTPSTNNLFSWIDALTMLSRLHIMDESTVTWLIHQSLIPDIGTMEVGTAGGAVFVANMSAGVPMPLLGYPARKTQHLPQANNSGDAILVDFSAYQIWDLGGAYMDFSEHVGFLNGLDTWRFGRYMDGKPLWRSEITLSDPQGAFTVSPFIRHND